MTDVPPPQARRDGDVDFDVVIASDLRFPGGTSHSIAEEVTAQSSSGYATALAHLNGPLVKTLSPVNGLVRRLVEDGDAELLVGPRRTTARLLILRHPAVAQSALSQLPPMDVEHVVVVANAGPDDIDGRRHYDPATVDAEVHRHLGRDPLWAPIGPQVRAEMKDLVPPHRLMEQDWVNIIDVDQWAVERPDWSGPRPVIGRHSRPSPQKWPENARVLRQVYPTDGSWEVRILGGADPAQDVLGSIPEAWVELPFGALTPRQFLAGLDFFVYYHDSRWVEAFGRTILEAIASGLPAVIPPHFKDLFGPAALYAEPAHVRSVIEELRTDRDRYERHVHQAREHVRHAFGHEAHRSRLANLIGPPSSKKHMQRLPHLPSALKPRPSPSSHPRVLLMSSNGSGMGHLTRLLAYARPMEDDALPYFLSMSQAVPIVSRFGFDYEYLPSTKAISMATSSWQKMFVSRVNDCIRRFHPDVVVFDGTWPYNGIPTIRDTFPEVKWIWSRRGMWRTGANVEQIGKSQWFDEVIEPGEFARPYDRGATAMAEATRIDPVTLVDRNELESRDEARQALGLPMDTPVGLISLGAGNINDTASDIGAATAALIDLGLDVCVTQPAIADAAATNPRVRLIRDYPLARRLSAFDVVISAAGYNSFQELMRMGVPALFVPNNATALDDQAARARFAADQRWAHTLDEVTTEAAKPLITDLLARGSSMARAVENSDPGNGATQGAKAILQVADQSAELKR